MQIKCLLELNCVCVLFLLTLHVRSSLLGPGGGRYQIRIPSRGCYEKNLMLTVVGLEPKETESPVGIFFIIDAMWPQGVAADRWNKITSSLPKFLHKSIFSPNSSYWKIVEQIEFFSLGQVTRLRKGKIQTSFTVHKIWFCVNTVQN